MHCTIDVTIDLYIIYTGVRGSFEVEGGRGAIIMQEEKRKNWVSFFFPPTLYYRGVGDGGLGTRLARGSCIATAPVH